MLRPLCRGAALLAAFALLDCHVAAPPADAHDPPYAAASSPSPHPLAAALVPQAPLSLTASDGTGLHLSRLRARAVLEGPLAYTEMTLGFDNPEDRTLEGTFRIALPAGASLARFAMKIGGDWQEGEVVEKQAAREAYEDALHHKQDPALLEQAAGNEFSARVFPIPAHARKELVIAWAQELPGDEAYVLPLRGLAEVDGLDVAASVAGASAPSPSVVREAWMPDADFVVPRTGAAAADGVRSGDLAVLRVRPVVDALPDPLRAVLVLFDSSASRALAYGDQIRRLGELAERLGTGAHLTVACFDQTVEEVFDGRAADFGVAAQERIRTRGALGASDVARALAWAKGRARAVGATRVVLMSDGVATAGSTERDALVVAARGLGGAGVERLDAVAVGGIREDALLRAMTTAGLGHDGVVVDAAKGDAEIARRLGEATRSKIGVRVDGARWWWPRTLDGVQSGDETLVYAEVAGAHPLGVALGHDAARAPRLASVDRPLVERAWAGAKVASLAEQQAREGDSGDRAKAILELSLKHRVVGPATAMLVLETDADYARFHVDRRALADILVVDGARVVRTARASAVVPPPAPVDMTAEGSSKGGVFTHQFTDDPLSGASLGAPPPALAAKPPPEPMQGAYFEMLDEAPRPTAARARIQPRAASGGGGDPNAPRAARDPAVRRAQADESIMFLQAGPGAAGAGAVAEASDKAPVPTYSGAFAEVMGALEVGDRKGALAKAEAMRTADAGDVMALVALGEALEATGDTATAGRAYGSIVDLFPERADMRRFAGERLDRLHDDAALDLALDTFLKAAAERPDHPSSHRLLAYALLRRRQYATAFDAIVAGLAHAYPQGRFAGVEQVLRDDVGLLGAAWAHAEPTRRAEILARVRAAGGTVEDAPSLRFVLTWETDANDVDLHVWDARGGHAYYEMRQLTSGGLLYADVTTGYGPECFTIRAPRGERAGPYTLKAHYYARGPMGYGMGKVEIIDHDGHGGLTFDERPFVVMNDQAFVELGTVTR